MMQVVQQVRTGAGTGTQAGFTPPPPPAPALCQAPREAWASVRKGSGACPRGCCRGLGLLPEWPLACRSQNHTLRLSEAATRTNPCSPAATVTRRHTWLCSRCSLTASILPKHSYQPTRQLHVPRPSPVGASLGPQTPNVPPGSDTHKGRLCQVPLSPRCFYDLLHGEKQGVGSSSHTRSGQSHRGKGTGYLSWAKWTGERENGPQLCV